ncbi:MAG: AbrB/MazE/SpoVT family DNA-binding domain-containing protein [Butyricicoccus pullicaecorum]|nr:AbrB/MazE/SpoVT family DNA-binding domain-containing protein [Butyricicoccus pullicaecorum]
MKATGIVRRIDDLGRVVIPKEIRRTMRIREGDPLEIYTDRDGEVIFKKYSPMGELGTVVGELAEALSRTAGMSCAICDRDAVIAAAGGAKKEIYEKAISADLEMLMEQRHIYEHNGSDETVHVSANDPYRVVVAAPIIAEGDVTGCVAFLADSGEEHATEVEAKLSQTAANFLSRHVTM